MDSHALLTSQGWRGSGHSLHTTSDSIGLSRPLLVSQKQNVLGIGKKQHRTSDMWWMNAFDKSLKGLDTSSEGQVVQTVTNGGLDMVKNGGGKFVGTGGLYASFVRGEVLGGTLTPEEEAEEKKLQVAEDIVVENKKEKRSKKAETKEERRARKAAKRAARQDGVPPSAPFVPKPTEQVLANTVNMIEETEEERKERRRLNKLARLQTVEEVIPSESTKKKKRARAEGQS